MEASVLDVDHILNICQRRCGDLGVGFRWDPWANTAYTDGNTICFPVPAQPITKPQLDILYGFVIHECGHHLRPEAFEILKAAYPPQHVASLYNIVEDDGMERERGAEWRGDKTGLSRMNSLLIQEAADKWCLALAEGNDKQEPEPLAALMIGQMSRLNWDNMSDTAVTALLNNYPTDAQQLVQDLVDEGWVERFRETETPHDTWDVAIDLAKRLYPDRDQEEYEEIRAAGHSMEGQRDDSDSTMPDKIGGSEDQGEQGEEEGDAVQSQDDASNGDEQCEAGSKDGQGHTVSWKDCVLSDHTEFVEGGEGGPMGITWAGRIPTGGVKLMPTDQVNVYDPRNSKAQLNEHGWDGWSQYMPTDNKSRQFGNRVRRYLQSQTRSKVRREREYGRLDRGTLVRLGMPPIDGGQWNRKIFYDQTKRVNSDTAIFVLTDWSGSMTGRKMQYAADASQRLVHTMERVLRMPVALAAFTNRRTRCDIGYIKPFNTRGMTEERIAQSFLIFEDWSSGNNDADAVNWAYTQLLKRKESRKILIVISDGAPSGSYGGHPDDALKHVTSAIEKAGKVELYGVGVTDDAVSRYYTNHKVIWNPEDINQTLFELIKDGDNV